MTATARKVLFVTSADDLETDVLSRELATADLELNCVSDISAARAWMEGIGLPHAMVIDLSGSSGAGIEFTHEMTDLAGMPVLMIANEGDDPAQALNALRYADDYIRRQYAGGAELALRIRRVLSRMPNFAYASGPEIKIADWLYVDHLNRQVRFHDEVRKLTPTENALLAVLLAHRGQKVDADVLIERVWQLDPSIKDRNALRVHMHRLRNKLEEDPDNPRFILTERGVGYSFAEEPADS